MVDQRRRTHEAARRPAGREEQEVIAPVSDASSVFGVELVDDARVPIIHAPLNLFDDGAYSPRRIGALAAARSGAQQIAQRVGGHRTGEVVALAAIAAQRPKVLELVYRLDPFGDDIHAQRLGNGDDGSNDGRVLRVALDPLDEGPVDLQAGEGETLEIGEGGVADAEVVKGEVDLEVVELKEDGEGGRLAAYQDSLRDFDLQAFRPQAGFAQRLLDLLDQRAGELARGEVDTNLRRGERAELVTPDAFLLARLEHHPAADWSDKPQLFSHRNEFGRGDRASPRVIPAQQRLDLDDLLGR